MFLTQVKNILVLENCRVLEQRRGVWEAWERKEGWLDFHSVVTNKTDKYGYDHHLHHHSAYDDERKRSHRYYSSSSAAVKSATSIRDSGSSHHHYHRDHRDHSSSSMRAKASSRKRKCSRSSSVRSGGGGGTTKSRLRSVQDCDVDKSSQDYKSLNKTSSGSSNGYYHSYKGEKKGEICVCVQQ